MALTREVVQEKSSGVTPGGKQIVRQKTQYSSPEAEEIQTAFTFSRLVYYVAGVIETLLAFRFALKALGASTASGFVNFIYSVTSPLELPFRNIFTPAVTTGLETRSIMEPSTLIAIFVYGLIATGIAELVRVLVEKNQ